MASIDKNLLVQWQDGDTFRAGDYMKERDMIVAAVNDCASHMGEKVDAATLAAEIAASEARDHLGTWQGLTPQDIMTGASVTPEAIGAASQSDLEATNALVNSLKVKRYNLADYPREEGETDDTGRFNRAIADCPAGSTLIVPDGYYYAEGIYIDKPVSIRFEGEATIESVNPSPDYILKYEGAMGTNNYVLASPASRGDRSIRLTRTPSDISPGDMILLTDDTVRYSDGMADVNCEVHEVFSVVQVDPNLVVQSGMNTDGNSDGIVDGFTADSSGSITATPTLSESAQKITVGSSGSAGVWFGVYQEVNVTGGKFYNLSVSCKTSGIEGRLYVEWYGASGSLGQFSEYVTVPADSDWTVFKTLNQQAPASATKARLYFQAYCRNGGETGSVWFKNADFREPTVDLILADMVRLPKSVSAAKNVVKITPVENVLVQNFRYRLKEGSTKGQGIEAFNVKNFKVSGLYGKRGAGSGIQIRRSMNVMVEKFELREPQVTGSGQGYGVQTFGGVLNVTIRDGVGVRMRHTIDLEGTFDALVENVTSYSDEQASFLGTHNGWCSDITFRACKALRCRSSGFVFESQGVGDPLTLTHYNVNIIDCEWQRDRDPADSTGYGFGVWFKCPVQDGVVRNFQANYGDGSPYTAGQDNGAIRMLPVRNKLLIDGLYASGFRRCISAFHASSVAETGGSNRVIIQNALFRNSNNAILYNTCTGRRLILRNIECENIQTYFMETSSGTFQEFVLDGLSFNASPSATLFQNLPAPDSGQNLVGRIANIRSDRGTNINSPAASWSLTIEDILLRGNGESVLFSGTVPNSGTSALPNGIVEGQRLSLLNVSGSTFTVQSSNILYKGGGSSISLSPTNRTALLEWRNGTSWFQIM